MSEKVLPDWERLEFDYRAGIMSVREIASQQSVSHTAIQKRAKTNGWDRDLAAKVKAKADSLVARAAVATQVAKISEKVIIETNAIKVADIQLGHRKDVAKLRQLIMQLTSQLEAPIDDISLQHKIDCAKKLAEAQKTLIGLEREAYGIDKDSAKDESKINISRIELVAMHDDC
jgi:hypothetical protein